MKRDAIQSHVGGLPEVAFGTVPKGDEVWEADDAGVHIKVTRHALPTLTAHQTLAVAVSGPPAERRRVLREFKAVYGTPVVGRYDFKDEDHIDVCQWLV